LKEGFLTVSKKTHIPLVFAGMMAALFIGALDSSVVNTAIPQITEELHGFSLISWVIAIYTLTTCVTTPIFGKLSDLFGRKIVFVIGVLLFVLGSILCGMAESMTSLIWFRALQGIGAGALTPVCFTLVGDLFQGEKRGKMMGVTASVWSVSGVLGPLVGGYFVDYVSWRWIFYINIPIGALALVLVAAFLHERFERKSKKIDYAGAAAFTISLSSLLYALLSGGEGHAWNSAVIIGLFVLSIVSLLLFFWIESRAEEPMIPLSLFKIRVLNISNVSGFLSFGVVAGTLMYAPIWIQTVLGHSATNSGLTVMPMSLAWPIATNLVGIWMYRIGIKASMVFGSVVVLAGTAWLTTMHAGSPYGFWVAILAILGFGMGFISTPSTVIVQSVVGWEQRGVANAAQSLMRTLGQTVAIAVFGTMFNSYVTTNSITELKAGMHAVFLLLFAVAVVNVIAVWFLPSHSKIMAQQQRG
jgi:EmrB/QacA subfamily drug resistance transporter